MSSNKRKKRKKYRRNAGLGQMIIEIIILVIVAVFIATAVLGLKGITVPVFSDVIEQVMSFRDSDTGREHIGFQGKHQEANDKKFQFKKHEDVEYHVYDQYVYLGDSRFVGMRDVCQAEHDIYICEIGQGYYWMLNQLDSVRAAVATSSNTALILELGVNDPENIDLYIAKANELAGELDCRVFYMTVNPVDEAVEARTGYDRTNEMIDTFNEQLVAGLDESITIIDTNSFLKNEGYETLDGIHYTDETYQMIYDFVKENVQSR